MLWGKQLFSCGFKSICIIAAIGLTAFCLRKHILDSDVCLVDYKKFGDDQQSIYPSITMCFSNPILEKKLHDEYGTDYGVIGYKEYVQGVNSDSKFEKIDYERVSLQLSDYVWAYALADELGDTFVFSDTIRGKRIKATNTIEGFRKPYVSYKTAELKCFTQDIPLLNHKRISRFSIRALNDVFPSGYRNDYNFYVYFHYPHQLVTSLQTKKWLWPKRENSGQSYTMKFQIQQVDVIRYRNKRQRICIEGSPKYDEDIIQEVVRQIGCNPRHWNVIENLSKCSKHEDVKNMDSMKNLRSLDRLQGIYQNVSQGVLPCQMIKNLMYSYDDMDIGNVKIRNKTHVRIHIEVWFMDSSFKEIKLVAAYNFESLIGDGGGYLGLFLGYAIWNVPGSLEHFFRRIQKWVTTRN